MTSALIVLISITLVAMAIIYGMIRKSEKLEKTEKTEKTEKLEEFEVQFICSNKETYLIKELSFVATLNLDTIYRLWNMRINYLDVNSLIFNDFIELPSGSITNMQYEKIKMKIIKN